MNNKEKVYNYPTKHKEGFIQSEIDIFLTEYQNINIDKFNKALIGVTCIDKENEIIFYRCDIIKALYYSIET